MTKPGADLTLEICEGFAKKELDRWLESSAMT
jgi:hypothetical protein